MIVVNIILFFSYTISKSCKLDFLAAYGIDGEETPQVRNMLLCPSIQFSCCTIFDELKFHKKWFDFYEPKVKLSHEKATSYYNKLVEPVKYFRNFDWTNRESFVIPEKLGRTKEIVFKLQKIQLDDQLRPILNDLPKLLEFETKIKKGFVCLLCDYSNHEYLNAKQSKLLVQQEFCQNLMSNYGPFLQKRAKLLNPLLMLANKAMGFFNTPHYQRRNIQAIKNVIKHKKAIEKCFPKENAPYDFENCKDLCNRYSISSLSPVFYGEFGFYLKFLDRFHKFKNWLEGLKEEKPAEKTDAEAPKDTEKPSQPAEQPKGRLLEASNYKIKRKINRISKSLRDYKKIIKNLRRYNNNYLKKIYRNSKKLERKRRRLGSYNDLIDYGDIYKYYNRNLNVALNQNQAAQNLAQNTAGNTVTQTNTGQQNTVQTNTNQQSTVQNTNQGQVLNNNLQNTNQVQNQVVNTNPQTNTGGLQNTVSNSNTVSQNNLNTQTNQQNNSNQQTQSNINQVDLGNDPKLGNSNCKNINDTYKCQNSKNITNSTIVISSENVTNSVNVTKSINVSNSFNIFNSTNVVDSLNINDSLNITKAINGSNLLNVTICKDCFNVTNSTNCTNCYNCTNVYNCTNCNNVYNVTDGFNIVNVTDSVNVRYVSNGSLLSNVTDSKNVTMLQNAKNMTNASNSSYCQNNYNCTGNACNSARLDGVELKQKIKEIVYKHSEKIIDRLYDLFRIGSLNGYKEDNNAFDPQIFRASTFYNDIDRFRYIFDNEGVMLDHLIGSSFVPEPAKVKEAALVELLKEKNSEDLAIQTEKKSDELRKKLADLANFNLVYGFITDVKRSVMSYDYIRGRLDDEIKFEDEEEKTMESHIEGDEDKELEPAQEEARKLMHVLKNHKKIKKTIN